MKDFNEFREYIESNKAAITQSYIDAVRIVSDNETINVWDAIAALNSNQLNVMLKLLETYHHWASNQ